MKLLLENGAKTDILDNMHHNCMFDSYYFNNDVITNLLNYNKTNYEHLTDIDYIKCII